MKTEKQQQAQQLYLHTNLTQAEIATPGKRPKTEPGCYCGGIYKGRPAGAKSHSIGYRPME
jgi:hypothetical protein